MIQRDKIMEDLMFKKHNSGFFIDKTTSMKTDVDGNIVSSTDRYRVSPSLPSETDSDAIKKEAELNAGIGIITGNIPISTTNIWDEVWENLDNYWEDFLKQKRKDAGVMPSTIKGLNSAYRYLKLFCVKGVYPDHKFYKKVQDYMEMLPNNFLKGKEWKGLTYQDIEKKFDNSNYPTLDAQTINKHMNAHKQFFANLSDENEIYLTNMDKLKKLWEEDKEDEIRNAYTDQDLINIFNSNLLDTDKKEFLLVSLFTGLRLSETSSLKGENIIDNCVQIFKGKTKAAKRIVPLHKEINDIILKRSNTKNEYLFFNGNGSANGKKLNRALHKIIPDDDKTLHSLRKNFSQAMEATNVGEEKYQTYLFGHSITTVRHKKYNKHKVNIDKLREIIDAIEIKYS